MSNLSLLYPEIILASAGLIILLVSSFLGKKREKLIYNTGILFSAAALAVTLAQTARAAAGTGNMWLLDPAVLLIKTLVIISAILALMLSYDYPLPSGRNAGRYTAAMLWASTGLLLLAGATDLIYIFLSLELTSICCFILAGLDRKNPKSAEGVLKYFLMGAISSAVTVYGISLFYAAAGTFSITAQTAGAPLNTANPAYLMGILFLLAGFGFKISMVPFHFWEPDAYEAGPAPSAAYISTAVKIAALGAAMRIFTTMLPHRTSDISAVFAVLAAFTMTIGNLTALFQTNIKRLLAYSSIAQAGYMLIGLTTADSIGKEGVLLYFIAYLAANMGAFAAAIAVGKSRHTASAGKPANAEWRASTPTLQWRAKPAVHTSWTDSTDLPNVRFR